MNWARVSVQAERERGEDRAAIAFGAAVDRFLDMLEARLNRDPVSRQKRELSGTARQPFERREAVGDGELPDRIHLRVEIDWRKPRPRVSNFGNPGRDLQPHVRR